MVSDALQDAIWDYYGSHMSALKGFHSIAAFTKSFSGEADVLAAYLRALPPSEHMVANAVLVRKANKDYLLLQIRSQVGRILFRNNGYYAVSALGDDVVQRAMQILFSPQYERLISR